MSKQRRAVSLDESVDEYLGREGINASQLVNKLVKRHMNGGASEDEIREFRRKQVKSEYEELASRARRKLEEYNELQDRENREVSLSDEEREEQLDRVKNVPADPTHPLVEDVASKLGMDAQAVINEVYDL